MLQADHRVVLLQHGGLDNLRGKTGLAMLRHRSGPIVAVVDPDHADRSLEEVTGIVRSVPVVGALSEALVFQPDVAVVGLAPSGGLLPPPLRRDVLAALQAGLHVARWTAHPSQRRSGAGRSMLERSLDLGSSPGAGDSRGWTSGGRRCPVDVCWPSEPIWPWAR